MSYDMRKAVIERNTNETKIKLELKLDGTGSGEIDTGIGFFNHMLDAFGRHGLFDLDVKANGDLNVDGHHTVEDVGIVLGQAFAQAIGDKRGIVRYGDIALPMDEALVIAAADLSGRAHLGYALKIPTEKIGSFDSELVKEFWLAFVREAACALHLYQLAGENSHHIAEASFKAAARALRATVGIDPTLRGEVLSTKGAL
jgi:imidazoleglycerol-phosphate dehydratase